MHLVFEEKGPALCGEKAGPWISHASNVDCLQCLQNGVSLLQKRVEKLEENLESMKDHDYEPIKKWISEHAPEAVQRAWAIMIKAEAERDWEVDLKRAALESQERLAAEAGRLQRSLDEMMALVKSYERSASKDLERRKRVAVGSGFQALREALGDAKSMLREHFEHRGNEIAGTDWDAAQALIERISALERTTLASEAAPVGATDGIYWCAKCDREVASGFVRGDGTHDGCGGEIEERAPAPEAAGTGEETALCRCGHASAVTDPRSRLHDDQKRPPEPSAREGQGAGFHTQDCTCEDCAGAWTKEGGK
jgi:hypothetical protein